MMEVARGRMQAAASPAKWTLSVEGERWRYDDARA